MRDKNIGMEISRWESDCEEEQRQSLRHDARQAVLLLLLAGVSWALIYGVIF
jgi:hypothetical protein